jgi:GDP-L-fucose synthase
MDLGFNVMEIEEFSLDKYTKIYVAGHNGLIGSSFIRGLNREGYKNIITASRCELDLVLKGQVDDFFYNNRPEVVILAAGRVGGIVQNRNFPADFITDNLSMQVNVLSAAYKYGAKRVIFFGSSCMYPRDASQPMSERLLCTGHVESTSFAYASAKYSGIQMCKAFNIQGKNAFFIPVIPNSVYGPNDNFNIDEGHVLSVLIRRFHDAVEENKPCVTLWGTGGPVREFIFVDDLVKACMLLLSASFSNEYYPINISSGVGISIKGLANKVKEIVGYSGEIKWDSLMPDGAPKKILDNSKIRSLGWKAETDLNQGIVQTYQWYIDSRE